jgi:hypothetical protein
MAVYEGVLRDESQRSEHTFLSARGRGSCVCFSRRLWHHPRAGNIPIGTFDRELGKLEDVRRLA